MTVFMQLKNKTIKELQEIIKKDYGKEISEKEGDELGGSLLRLTRTALNVMAKKEKEEKRGNQPVGDPVDTVGNSPLRNAQE